MFPIQPFVSDNSTHFANYRVYYKLVVVYCFFFFFLHYYFIRHSATTAVSQYYEVDVNKEPVIKGNSVVMKCGIPSFVADYVTVLSWSTGNGEHFYPGIDYGI